MGVKAFLIGLMTALVAQAADSADPPADIVLRHGVVITVDAKDSVASALAVRDGRIVAVGDDKSVTGLIGPKTRVIDLAGRTVTPGLIDSHAHLQEGGVTELFKIDLTRTASLADLLAAVKARAQAAAPGEWVVGAGWNEGLLAEHRGPTRAELDAVSVGHPVVLWATTGHSVAANSAALALAKIGPDTPDPPGGSIERDAAGRPTGILKELAAMNMVLDLVPPITSAQRRAAVSAMIDKMHAEGMTGVKDPAIGRDAWVAYRDLARDGLLTAHVCPLFLAGNTLDTAKTALALAKTARAEAAAIPGGDLSVCGMKVIFDGAAMARTAWMGEDYPVDAQHPAPTGRGFPNVQPDTFRQMVRMFVAAGEPIGTHAIGDRTVDVAADAYLETLKADPHKDLRLSLIHVHDPSPHAMATIEALQKDYGSGIIETQGEFLWWLGDALPGAFGLERSKRLMPLATYHRKGLIYASGSDYPVTPLAARYGLWASVAREPLQGRYGAHPFGVEEAADIRTALRSYTQWAARQLFVEKDTGSLEIGKLADLAVWDRNPYAVPTADLKDMRCEMTLYRGRVVFER